MFGIGHIKRKLTGGSSSSERPASTPASPQRTSPQRHASPHGMPPSRQAGVGSPAAQGAQPRVDIRAAGISSSPPLDWSIASQLYDPGVIAAERRRVNQEMFSHAPTNGDAFRPNRPAVEQAVQGNIAARANAANLPRAEITRRLEGNLDLQAEVNRVGQKMQGLVSGGFRYRRAELVHIASENLAARARGRTRETPLHQSSQPAENAPLPRYQPSSQRTQRDASPPEIRRETPSDGAGPSRREESVRRPGKEAAQPESSETSALPNAAGWRSATSRRTRPSSQVANGLPSAPTAAATGIETSGEAGASSAASDGPKFSRSNQFQGRRFGADYASVRPQGSAEPSDAPSGTRRRVSFAEYAVREGIAEKTDGSKGKPARLPRELRDNSLSEIGQQIRKNQILESQGMLVDDEDEIEGETSESGGSGTGITAPLTLESLGFSIEDDGHSDDVSSNGSVREDAVQISEDDQATIDSMTTQMPARYAVGR